MKDDIVKTINEFILGKQDALLVIQYIDNICIINSRPKKISITIQDDDYWKEPYFYGDYKILEENETLAWNIQFNSKVIHKKNLKDLLKILNNIFTGKKIVEPEALKPMPYEGNYQRDLLSK